VDVLHRLFEANGNEQTDDDGRDMNKEVRPGVCGMAGWMHIEHGIQFL
jgi:hypothetical protein